MDILLNYWYAAEEKKMLSERNHAETPEKVGDSPGKMEVKMQKTNLTAVLGGGHEFFDYLTKRSGLW